MQKLFNRLRGSVTAEVEGPFLERWFNICAANRLGLWDVQLLEEGRKARVTFSRWRWKEAEELAATAMCTLSPAGEAGLPSFLRRFRFRYGMIAGAVLFVLLLTLFSRFIMVIEIEGNETVSDSAILAGLQNHGFGVGSYGPGVDVRDLSNEMLLDMEELSFLTVDITGIRARVIVRETEPVPEIEDDTKYADISAAADGFVVDMNVIAGRPAVEEGQAVLKGDVLISSLLFNERSDGSGEVFSTQQVRAKGQIWAVTERTLAASTPLSALRTEEDGEMRRRWGLEFLGRRFNFYGNSSNYDRECAKISILYPITLPTGQTLPFGLWQTDWTSWSETPVPVNPESAAQFLQGTLTRRLETLLGDGEILDAQWQTEQREGVMTVTLHARCLEQIGITVELN
ncbi:MAG: sporulation protein YqfD [Oscillospiraceae bacterium]|nr:sporulation protein YqfD [Oscillospiraceae bacterium]